MSATYNTVLIGSTSYPVYADLDTADQYIAAASGSGAVAYRAETDADQKGRWAVTATRTLDRLRWPGEKTEDDQELAWPRTGVSGYADSEIPQAVIDAACELMIAQAGGYDVSGTASTASNVKRQKAGSVEIEYFLAPGGTRLPLAAWELIAPLLAGANRTAGSYASGTCGDSITDDDFHPDRSF